MRRDSTISCPDCNGSGELDCGSECGGDCSGNPCFRCGQTGRIKVKKSETTR